MIPLFRKDCEDSRGLVIPQLSNYNSEKSLSLCDIEALSIGQSLGKYDAMVIYDSHDPIDRAFR